MTESNMGRVTLRAYEAVDASTTLSIFTEAITETAAAHYTAEQIEAWARPGRHDLAGWNEAMSARASVVAVLGGAVVGFSDVDRNGYIDMLFVSPKHVRRGVARTLLSCIEQRARATGAAELSSNVSISARPFFESMGFEVIRKQRPIREGVELTNYRMTKVLVQPSAAVR